MKRAQRQISKLFPAKTLASDWLTELVDQSKAWFFGRKEHLKIFALHAKNDDFSSHISFDLTIKTNEIYIDYIIDYSR